MTKRYQFKYGSAERWAFLSAKLVLFGVVLAQIQETVSLWIFDQPLGYYLLAGVFGLFGLRYIGVIVTQQEDLTSGVKASLNSVNRFTVLLALACLIISVPLTITQPAPTGFPLLVFCLYMIVSDLRDSSAQDTEIPESKQSKALSAEEVAQMTSEDWNEFESE